MVRGLITLNMIVSLVVMIIGQAKSNFYLHSLGLLLFVIAILLKTYVKAKPIVVIKDTGLALVYNLVTSADTFSTYLVMIVSLVYGIVMKPEMLSSMPIWIFTVVVAICSILNVIIVVIGVMARKLKN